MAEAQEEKEQMKQYCRYCAHCFQADEDEFRCSDHPRGEEPHWTRQQINRENRCRNFALSELGDAETGRKYEPRPERHKIGEQVRMW